MNSWLSLAVSDAVPSLLRGVAAAALSLGASGAALAAASDHGPTLAEALAQSSAAWTHLAKVGTAQTAKDLMTDPAWQASGLAVVMVDHAGRVLASSLNPAVVGQNKSDLKDPNGKPWVREAIAMSSARRAGWVNYQFIDASTRQRVNRTMFVSPWPAGDGFIGIALNRP